MFSLTAFSLTEGVDIGIDGKVQCTLVLALVHRVDMPFSVARDKASKGGLRRLEDAADGLLAIRNQPRTNVRQ